MKATVLTLTCLFGHAAGFGGMFGGGSKRGGTTWGSRGGMFGNTKSSYTVHHINETFTPTRCGETSFTASKTMYQKTLSAMDHTFPLVAGACSSVGYTEPWTKADGHFVRGQTVAGETTYNFPCVWCKFGGTDFSKTKIKFFKQPAGGSAVKIPNIVELAVGIDYMKTLVTAVKAADLVTTLSSGGPFTVFAPTDGAFAKLPPGALAALLKPENKALLVKVLTYHVVPGKIYSESLSDGQTAATVEKQDVTFTIDLGDDDKAGEVMVNQATIITPDVLASNGVVHTIDEVLLFPGFKQEAKAALSGDDAPSAGACEDSGLQGQPPAGAWGSCSEYKQNQWCTSDGAHTGHQGNGWQSDWGTLDAAAKMACCACGGGSDGSGGKGGAPTMDGPSVDMLN